MINLISKPNKQISQTTTTWSQIRSFGLNYKRVKFTNAKLIPEIQKLVQELTEVTTVKRVRALAPRYPDIHDIDFEVQLQSNSELTPQIWDKLEDKVIEFEWKLRDESGEKWYFHIHVVSKISPLIDSNKKLIDSHEPQIWSSLPLKLVLINSSQA